MSENTIEISDWRPYFHLFVWMSGMYLLTAIIIAIVYLFTYLFGCLSMIKSIDLLVFISYVVNGFVEATALLMKNLNSKLAWFFFQKKKIHKFWLHFGSKGTLAEATNRTNKFYWYFSSLSLSWNRASESKNRKRKLRRSKERNMSKWKVKLIWLKDFSLGAFFRIPLSKVFIMLVFMLVCVKNENINSEPMSSFSVFH